MIYVIIWIGASLVVGIIGIKRKVGFTWAFLTSLFLSPVVGLIATLLYKDEKISEDSQQSNDMESDIFFKSNNRSGQQSIVTESESFFKSLVRSIEPKEQWEVFKLYKDILKGSNELESAYQKSKAYIIDLFCQSFDYSTRTNDFRKAITKLQNDKRFISVSEGSINRKSIEIPITVLIKRWIELQDELLLPTFKKTMNYTDNLIESINNSLTKNELKFAENILSHFYEDYLMGEITGLSLRDITIKDVQRDYTCYLPFKKYSNIQLVDSNWRIDVFNNPFQNNEFTDTEVDENNEIDKDEFDIINDNIDKYWGDSLFEVSNRNFLFYGTKNGKIIIKHPILEVDIFESLNKYIFEIETYKNLSLSKKKFLYSFDNEKMDEILKLYHGFQEYKQMRKLIDAVYKFETDRLPDF